MKRYIAAIDLGTTKVVSLIGEQTPEGVKIIALEETPSKGIMRGEVVNIQNVLDAMTPTFNSVRSSANLDIKDVYVGIAGQNIRCESNSNRRNRSRGEELITEQEIQDMEREMYNSRVTPGEEVLHVLPQYYNVGDHLGQKDPVGMPGGNIEGNYKIFIGRSNSAEHTKSVISRAGLRLKKLILEPVASAKAVLTEDETEIGVAMVDIGGGTTDLLIYHDNIIRHTAVIPFGGNSITEDLRQGCGISLKNAEQLKIQYGSCYSEYVPDNKNLIIPGIGGRDSREVSFKVIANIIEARVAEIFEAVMYEIEKSGYADKLMAGIVLTGGGSALANLCQYVKYMTGYETRIAAPEKCITFDSCEGSFKPSSATAVGLVLKGFEYESKSGDKNENVTTASTLFPVEEIEEVNVEKSNIKKEVKKHSGSKILKTLPNLIGSFFDTTDNEA